ncbi:hypothetical protein HZC07_05020, partial [Candidatus Micrarchaeota archaeon]|nr:hypothetical protein [Candidatus Micrarchaeota archaeon]
MALAVLSTFLPLLLISLHANAAVMIGMSFAFGIMFTAILFLIAYGSQNNNLLAVAKEELAAILFSAFIIMFWLSFDATMNSLVSGLLQSGLQGSVFQAYTGSVTSGRYEIGHIEIAMATLDILASKLKAQYFDLYLFEALIGFLSTVSFPAFNPIPVANSITFTIAPFTGLTLLSNAHTVVVETISYLMTVIWAKQFLLIFARDVVPLLLLPLGLVLRAFPWFRTTGSSVLAIAFAVYFVLPFAILFSNYLIFDLYKPADFAYSPAQSGYFNSNTNQNFWTSLISKLRSNDPDNPSKKVFEQFNSPDAADVGSSRRTCYGNTIVRLLCSAENIGVNAYEAGRGFVSTSVDIAGFMFGMTGDFGWSTFTFPLMPGSTSAGLFYFLV